VVDNKKEEHRYKYHKKVIYIEKEQIEEASKVAHFLQEHPETLPASERTENDSSPEPLLPLPVKEVEKEIIENKVEEGEQAEELGE
jgi:hypothetical protein